MDTMLSVTEAQDIILSRAVPSPVQVLPLKVVLGRVLAVPVRAEMNVPAFDHSAMDGVALDHRATASATAETPLRLPVIGFQAAGIIQYGSLKPGKALRIATGAYVPLDATAVIPQEELREEGEEVLISSPVREGAHIRRCGEETRRGDLVLSAGTVVTPAVLGYLSSIGITEIPVHIRPQVGIVATGTELVPLGGAPGPGQIFDSNSIALAAAMQVDGIAARVYPAVADDVTLQRQALAKVVAENDVVVVTGGVSVGRLDHVRDLMQQLDITPLFWKVRQKPGKPLVVGERRPVLFFGLPGNPASSLVAYYEYVRPALRRIMGHAQYFLPEMHATTETGIVTDPGKTYFLRARLNFRDECWRVMVARGQNSNGMRSFAEANAIVVIPEEKGTVARGESVRVQILPAWQG